MMQYQLKKKRISTSLLTIIIVVLFFVILNIFSYTTRNLFYTLSSPFQKVLWSAGQRASNFLSPFFAVHKIKDENVALLEKNNQLMSQLISLEGVEAENQILRDALGQDFKKEFNLVLAGIISKDTQKDYILIDRGAEDGISQGMPVISAQKVLFGKVSEVYKNYSQVKLISEKGFAFDVKVKEKDIYGVVRGDGNSNIFLDLIPRDDMIADGDVILTSSLEGNFPKDLLIGTINKIKKEDTKPFQTAELTHLFNITTASELFVVTNFKN